MAMALTPKGLSMALMYWGKVSQVQGGPALTMDAGTPSTLAKKSMRKSRSSGRTGAMEKLQLPRRTEVTPWKQEGEAVGSQTSWAS